MLGVVGVGGTHSQFCALLCAAWPVGFLNGISNGNAVRVPLVFDVVIIDAIVIIDLCG